jgi:hypothetical protein
MTSSGEFITFGLDTHGLHLWLEAKTASDAVMKKSRVFILKFDDSITVETDKVVVLGLIQKVRIVKRLVATKIDFSKQVAVHEKLKRAINGGTGNSSVELAGFVQKFVSIKMIVRGKGGLDNDVPLLGAAEALSGEVSF